MRKTLLSDKKEFKALKKGLHILMLEEIKTPRQFPCVLVDHKYYDENGVEKFEFEYVYFTDFL